MWSIVIRAAAQAFAGALGIQAISKEQFRDAIFAAAVSAFSIWWSTHEKKKLVESTGNTERITKPPSAVPLILLAGLLLGSGCSSIAPGSDPIVVNAQRSMSASFDLVDAFLRWEYVNRHAVARDVTDAADIIRTKFPPAFEATKSVLATYRANKTPEAKADLMTWLATLREIEAQARVYYSPRKP